MYSYVGEDFWGPGSFSYEDFSPIGFAANEVGDMNYVMLDEWLARKPLFVDVLPISALDTIADAILDEVTLTVEMTTTKGKRFVVSNKIHAGEEIAYKPGVSPADKGVAWLYVKKYLATRVDQ